MKKQRHLLLAFAVLFAGANLAASAAAPVTTPAVQFDAISLQRTACRGSCPVYSVSIFSDGRVRYVGHWNVDVTGLRESTITAQDVERVRTALVHATFPALRNQYQLKEDGCADEMTDLPGVLLSLEQGGKKKSVYLYGGCSGPTVPTAELEALAAAIDSVAKTTDLIYGGARAQ